MMTFEIGVSLALAVLSVVVVPSISWLVKEVLDIRNHLVRTEEHLNNTDRRCEDHRLWTKEIQGGVNRIDKNVCRLCQQNGIEEVD